MNRISMTFGVLVAVLSVIAATQTIRLGSAREESLSLRVKLEAAQKEAAKSAARATKTAGGKDDSWNTDSDSWVRTASRASASSPRDSAQDAAAVQSSEKAAGKANMDPAHMAADLVHRAEQLAKEGKLDQAQTLLQQSVKQDPNNPDAWRSLAAVQRDMGNSKAELQTYQQWMTARPADSQARYMAAQAYARNGMDGEALKYLSQFESMSSGNAQAYNMAAKLYGQLNMPVQQGNALRQAATAAPQAVDTHQQLGDYYQSLGQADQALAEYQAAVQIQPTDTKALVQMGNTYLTLGQADLAQAQYEAALAVNPKNIDALQRLAEVEYQTGDLQGALSNYQQISTLQGQMRDGLNANRHIEIINRELQAAATTPKKPK